jgi:hypothetical protein
MSDDEPESRTTTNIERLRGHLEDETLAAELVDTYRTGTNGELASALQAVAEARLKEIRATLETKESSDASD